LLETQELVAVEVSANKELAVITPSNMPA
jgi:hypothetical protein